MSAPDRWLIKWGKRCIQALGLQEWDVTFSMERQVDGDDRLGKAFIQYPYEVADILIRDNMKDDRAGRTLVMHELLHPTNQHKEIAVKKILQMIPDEQQREVATQMWVDAKEVDIVHLSRALTRWLSRDYPK